MDRFYTQVFAEHLQNHRQMLFVMGPRQVGKTTTSLDLKAHWRAQSHYFNWDRLSNKKKILEGSEAVATAIGIDHLSTAPPLVIFDEIHKYGDWKNFLKGFYDAYPNEVKTVVTGSARLNVFKRGGDSLMGRYFYYHFHPLTIAEILHPTTIPISELRKFPTPIDEEKLQALLQFGGFPDPYLKNETRFANRWKTIRLEQLFEEDIRSLAKIQEIGQMEVLAELLRYQVGQLVSYESLAKKVQVTSPTIRNWLEILQSFYYCFEVRPYSKNVTRSLLKQPKYYLWDWSLCKDTGSRVENFVASHLYKAVDFWTDYGFGNYQLYFLRDKDKREVDFVIVKDDKPWMLIETKNSGQKGISPTLHYFQEMTEAPYAFQVGFDLPFVDKSCFDTIGRPLIVPARTLLSQLV